MKQNLQKEEEQKPKKKQGRAAKRELLRKREIQKGEGEKGLHSLNRKFSSLSYDDENYAIEEVEFDGEVSEVTFVEAPISGSLLPVVLLEKMPSISIEKPLLLQMLRRENEIRLSEEIQSKYTSLVIDWDHRNQRELFTIDRRIQMEVLRDFGLEGHLDAYQFSCWSHMGDPGITFN